jgi:protein gp37
MSKTAIAWTEYTWNPVTGCDRVSPGCDHCYALTMAKRLKAMGAKRYQADGDPRTSGPGFGVTMHWELLNAPRTWRGQRMVFVNSMSDLFHAKVEPEFIRGLFDVIRDTPQHTYQVLTKRPLRARKMRLDWPPNLWMGVSVEAVAQKWRVDVLRDIPAAVRFLSCEPLLADLGSINLDGIGWVIAGGESGPHFRPLEADWVRHLRDECINQGAPFFFKQWAGVRPKALGRELDGRTWDEMPDWPARIPEQL